MPKRVAVSKVTRAAKTQGQEAKKQPAKISFLPNHGIDFTTDCRPPSKLSRLCFPRQTVQPPASLQSQPVQELTCTRLKPGMQPCIVPFRGLP